MQLIGLKKEEKEVKLKNINMSTIQEEASGKKSGEIRYLTPLEIDNSTVKKYCRFKKYGIKYVDYKDSDFLLKFINEQGKLLPRRITERH